MLIRVCGGRVSECNYPAKVDAPFYPLSCFEISSPPPPHSFKNKMEEESFELH